MADSGEYTPETIANRQRIADALLMQAVKPREIRHWAQGLGQMGEAALGGYLGYRAEEDQKAGSAAQAAAIASILGGGQPAAATPSGAAPLTRPAPTTEPVSVVKPEEFNSIDALASPAGQFDPNYADTITAARRAVAKVESGGSGGHSAVGPAITSGPMAGQRALGSTQVMEGNVGPWTKAATGTAVTPQQFLDNPDLQNTVFNAEFGKNYQKYGNIADPSSIWFSGKPVSEAGGRRDQLGTTVPGYVQKVGAALTAQPGATNAPAPASVAPGPAADDNKAKVAAMLNDPNPYVRKMGIQLGQAAIAKQLASQPKYHKLNDEMLFEEGTGRTMAAGPGFKPLVDPAERAKHGIPAEDKRPYQIGPGNKLINPPAETRLTVDQRGETSFDTKAGQLQAERLDKIVQDGMAAKSMIGDMNALRDIGSRITTGKTAEVTAALGPYAEALGLKIEGLGDLQAYEAITSKLAPQMRVPGSGATSDFEMKTFMKAIPSLGKTPEGNEIVAKTFEAIQEQKQVAADIASRVLTKEMSRADGEKALRALPDPLTLWKERRGSLPTERPGAAVKAAPVNVTTPDEARKVPKGTPIMLPSGEVLPNGG